MHGCVAALTRHRVTVTLEGLTSFLSKGDHHVRAAQAETEAIDSWIPAETGRRGGQTLYSDPAIETALILRLIFHQPLRQAEGFLGSLLKLMGLDLPCPDHTTLSRRNQTVEVSRRIEHLPAGPIDFVVDSTGLEI